MIDVAQIRVVVHLRSPMGGAPGEHAALSTASGVCYHVLGIVHALWPPVPGRVKDYIATPKTNGYQALHTCVLPFGDPGAVAAPAVFPLELQIRTERMHCAAERGITADGGVALMARWHESVRAASLLSAGTSNGNGNGHGTGLLAGLSRDDMSARVRWLTSLREWQTEFVDDLSAREFVDTVASDVLASGGRVFVFTPKGGVLSLPRGSTPVDFAYHVHSDVGNRMVIAKVNGVVVSAGHQLKNGDVVDITTCGTGRGEGKGKEGGMLAQPVVACPC